MLDFLLVLGISVGFVCVALAFGFVCTMLFPPESKGPKLPFLDPDDDA